MGRLQQLSQGLGQKLGQKLHWHELGYRRTAVAAVLTAVAVAVPSVAWYLVGSRQAEREIVLKQKIVADRAAKKAVVLAERLATRLEVLREAETRRAFYHYQNLYHDPKAAAEGASVGISPLAQGPSDPLIEVYFQVDNRGELSLPTLNDEFPELGLQAAGGEQCEMLGQLEQVAVFCRREGLETPVYAARSEVVPASHQGEDVDCLGGPMSLAERRIEELSPEAWSQHLRANELYADLKEGRKPAVLHHAGAGSVVGKTVAISIGSFEWRTLALGETPELVALRRVETPAGPWTQGFVISAEAVEVYLRDSSYPASFEPHGEPRREHSADHVVMSVPGTPWAIVLDLSQTLLQEAAKSRVEGDRFERIFLFCVLAALAAGVLVVAMVGQAEHLANERSQFAASAAHELRTPIAGLRLYSEMLAEGLGDPGRARDYARRLAGEAERLGRVVTNVLSFTRLERKTLTVDPQPGDLREVVAETFARHRPALEQAGAEVVLELPEEVPTVRFDPDAVGQILQNLLDNAEKYTRDVSPRRIVVRLEEAMRAVRLSVADNGRGVPRRERRHLFRPFHRGVESNDAPAGLGLGLVLVQALAAAQGGEIRYADAPQGGAVFTVSFPR